MNFYFIKVPWISNRVFKYSVRPDANPMSSNYYANSSSSDKDKCKNKTRERAKIEAEAAEIWDILGEERFKLLRFYFATSDFVPKTVWCFTSIVYDIIAYYEQ